jgi:hypothetical protein
MPPICLQHCFHQAGLPSIHVHRHACTTMHVHAHVARYLRACLCDVTCRCTLGHAGHDSMTLCRFIFMTEDVHACIHIHVRTCCMLHVHIHVHVQGRTHTYSCMLHHVHVHVQDRNHTYYCTCCFCTVQKLHMSSQYVHAELQSSGGG